ncbi:hypothetical protein [Ulvibacter litoralis]|uniref:Uncharacterized protein n=1 Tax=Ulvibacter litoralis TaxID=227084 RepID=A0A1G7C394_9FLAO|nr:hypothetical protein [Ulvibacter litoralis]GHC48795.1 hypothetical protein GCM10008083_10250 [Ulvibacter litoralis]SDE33854.1 hypothetical protein SAMN05421855_101162 [Ulvibacter litoralis]
MSKHKVIRFFIVLTVLLLQIVFLAVTVKEKYETDNFAAILSILLILLTIFFGYRYLDLHHHEYAYEQVSVVIWVPIGAVVCYVLNVYGNLGSVLAAGITGTVASFLPLLRKESFYLKKLPNAMYCGAFVGMSSVAITPSIGFVVAAGILAGVFYMLSKNLFLGIGGKLGTIAFVGVVLVSLINWIVL